MKNFVQDGDVLTLTAPRALTSGAGFLVGSIFAVATADAASGATVEGFVDGVVDLNCLNTEAYTVGQAVYWDNTNFRCTSTVGSNTKIGTCVLAKPGVTASDNIVRVRLNGVF